MNNQSRKIKFFTITSILLFLVILFLGGEVLIRILWKGNTMFVTDERNLNYEFDEELGWFPTKNNTKNFFGSRLINIEHNENGFRDKKPLPKKKKRIAFIGDSFVWGYDAEKQERFTDKLQAMLPNWEINNLGVSGYGTDQEYLLLQKWFHLFQPDIVCLVYNDTDWEDNSTNINHGGYYKPYFEEVDNKLARKGVPVIKSLNYYHLKHPLLFKSLLVQFLYKRYTLWVSPLWNSANNPTLKIVTEMRSYVESQGAKFIIALVNDTKNTEKGIFLDENNINQIFLLNNFTYPTNGYHWTPKGHDYVCSTIYEYLIANGFVSKESVDSFPHRL